MTAEVLIYARGGGLGHAARGIAAAELLMTEGRTCLVLIRAGVDLDRLRVTSKFRDRILCSSFGEMGAQVSAETLMVDTFPFGWREQFDLKTFRRFKHRVFLARYAKDFRWSEAETFYDELLIPYSEELCEWEWVPARAKHIGFLIRPQPAFAAVEGPSFALFDPESRCPDSFVKRIEGIAVAAGYQTQIARDLEEPIHAAKLLIVGAGYNTFYEALESGIDARFLPVHKRYDDQFRRAERWERSLADLREMEAWLLSAAPKPLSIPLCTSLSGMQSVQLAAPEAAHGA